ncbi:MAG: exodeoxyribonuclease III [Deltaproteobacteria bacterium]|nr:exodeoxyribonuclease III [Deltaproteobacteria bacterium]
MKIETWNVNGIRARQAQVLELIERDRPDILCLQEIKAAMTQVPESLCKLAGYECYWHGERAYSGVGLHIRQGLLGAAPKFSHPSFDHENRIVTAQIGDLIVASVYIPNGGKDFAAKMRFLEAMETYVAESHAEGKTLIICGDINIARTERDVHPKERKPNLIGQRPEERELLERILARGLVDVGRALDPENNELFTWWPPWRNMRQRNIGWRLDYLFVSEKLAGRAVQCSVLRDIGTSDHAPVSATIELPDAAVDKPSAIAAP